MQAWWFHRGDSAESAFFGVFSFAASLVFHGAALITVVVVIPVLALSMPMLRGCVDAPVEQTPPVEFALVQPPEPVPEPEPEPVVEEQPVKKVKKRKPKRKAVSAAGLRKLKNAMLDEMLETTLIKSRVNKCACDKTKRCDASCACDKDCSRMLAKIIGTTSKETGILGVLSGGEDQIGDLFAAEGVGGLGLKSIGRVEGGVEGGVKGGVVGGVVGGLKVEVADRKIVKRVSQLAIQRCDLEKDASLLVRRRRDRVIVTGSPNRARPCVKRVFLKAKDLKGNFTTRLVVR